MQSLPHITSGGVSVVSGSALTFLAGRTRITTSFICITKPSSTLAYSSCSGKSAVSHSSSAIACAGGHLPHHPSPAACAAVTIAILSLAPEFVSIHCAAEMSCSCGLGGAAYSDFPHNFSSDSVSVPGYGFESGILCCRLTTAQVVVAATVWGSAGPDIGGKISGVETVHQKTSCSIGSISAA